MGNPVDPVSALTGGFANSSGENGGGQSFSWIGDITGANAAARAAGNAAIARERQLKRATETAEKGLTRAQGAGRGMVKNAGTFASRAVRAAQSPQELRALNQAFEKQSQALNRQAELFASIDPAVMEASQQALQLLRGEEAKSLAPLKEKRQRDREALVNRLREQMGPGAETSTAGIQALNQFDQQTSEVLSGAQQQGLSQLFGIASSGASNRGALGAQTANLANIGGMFGQRAGRLSGAQFNAGQLTGAARANAAGLEQQGFANVVNAQTGQAAGAGSQFVEGQLRAQAQNQFINDRIQAGEQIGASMAGGAGAACCFIFLEARYGNGTMDNVVRKFRNEQMTLRNKRGYYKVAEVLVPLMRKHSWVKSLVRLTMTDPLVAYGKYHYGENKWGWIFKPVKNFWLGTFDLLADEVPYLRENGEYV